MSRCLARFWVRLAAALTVSLCGLVSVFHSSSVQATAVESSITVQTSTNLLSFSLMPSPNGEFGTSNNSTISVSTDNYSGYTLSIIADTSTSLENGDGDEIESISTAISGTTFASNSAYNNKWGYKPSQYVTSSNNVNTVVLNTTDYLPSPDAVNGDILDITSTANSVAKTYTMSFGARVDMSLPAGTYSNDYVLVAVGNPVVYNITYDENSNGTVGSMPSPNPQVVTIDGGTAVAQSYVTLSNAVPTLTDRTFGGWCDVATTTDATTGNYECSGTTYAAGSQYGIDQTTDGSNITLHAIWLVDPFPVVWSQMGACEFHGNGGGSGTGDEVYLITGSQCTEYHDKRFIDTEKALYSNENYEKDYEVHFTIDAYVPSSQTDNQSTLFSDKLSTSTSTAPYNGKAPGIIVRRNTNSGLEIKSTYGRTTPLHEETKPVTKSNYAGTDIRIFRINKHIYTSVDNGPLIELQDYTDFDQQFGLTAWFGAYPDNVNCSENCTAAKRYFTGTLSNMYIKMGTFDTNNLHTITLNANGGTLAGGSTFLIVDGDAIGNNIEDPTRTNWLFDGWLDENDQWVTSATVPDADETYTAQWTKTVTQAAIANDSISMNVSDTETISVTNAAELEPYTFSSSNSSVASVDSSTGLVTGVASGSVTITMTGTRSGATKTITVNVIGSALTISFDAAGGYAVQDVSVGQGATLNEIPYTERSGYVLDGWYTGTNGTGTKLDTSTHIMASTTYHAYWLTGDFVCKVAETLHTEQCLQTTGNTGGGCRNTGFQELQEITFGHLVDSAAALTAGAAYDCDVDYDGTYDDDMERFYYFGTENGNAKLVHSVNLINTSQSYTAALTYLPNYELDQQSPSTPVWDNPHLVTYTSGSYTGKAARFMTYAEATNLWGGNSTGLSPTNGASLFLFEKSAFSSSAITDGIWLELEGTDITSRIQTRAINYAHGKNKTQANAPRATIDFPEAYLEKYYVPPASYTITFDPQNGTSTFTETITPGDQLGNAYPSPDPTYTDYLFQGWYDDPTGGNLITSSTEPSGSTTYYAQWKGKVVLAQVASNSVSIPLNGSGTITITNAADLEQFEFSSSDTTVATIDQSTGVITPVATGTTNISIYGTESQTTNSNIVTVTITPAVSSYRVTFDPQNGDSTSFVDVPAGTAIGALMPASDPTYADHAFIRWYDSASGNDVTSATTPSGPMTVYAEWKLDVTQATLSNNDLTLPVGGQINLGVSNTAQLEPYTLSSQDSTVATIASDGTITGVSAGTTNVIMAGSKSNLTKSFEVNVTAAPVVQRTVTFNTNGGSMDNGASTTRSVDDGDPVGSLPTASKTNNMFFGWYTDDGTFYEEVYPTTTVDSDITYYALWVENDSSFPIEFAETNVCEFRGTTSLTGNYCTTYYKNDLTGNYAVDTTKTYIDSGVALYSTDNYDSDYEIGFTIVEYDYDSVRQMTLVADKWENTTAMWPGLAIRRYDATDYLEITNSMGGTKASDHSVATSTTKQVKIVREGGVIKYSINDGSMITLQNMSGLTKQTFNYTVWFGASATENSTAQRQFIGKLTDMYVKLRVSSDYVMTFDADGGVASEATRSVPKNSAIGTLPTMTTSRPGNYTFTGWYNENNQLIDATYTPTSNETITAHWTYASSYTPVSFDMSNNATRGYKTIIDGWVQSPTNISTFNKSTTVPSPTNLPWGNYAFNYSTWGDTSELSEVDFWTGLKTNFQSNQCLIPSYSDASTTGSAQYPVNYPAWTNGTVDCAKPDAYNTYINDTLEVYLYDTTNSTIGTQVNYVTATNGIITNMIPGETYYWQQSSDHNNYGVVTVTSNSSNTGPRWVDTGTLRNTRDLGGLPVIGGGTLKYGKLFRGERIWNSTANAQAIIKLGADKEYNLAGGTELDGDVRFSDIEKSQGVYYEYQQDAVIHYDFEYHQGDELNLSSNYMKAWTAVTDIMTDVVAGKNIFFHCRVGADRTGTAAYLLEGLLGVTDEARYEEYSLSHLSGLYDRTRYYKQKNSTSNNLKFVYMMTYVPTVQSIHSWYMSNPNADASLITDFRTAMIDNN